MKKGIIFILTFALTASILTSACSKKEEVKKANTKPSFELIAHRGFDSQFPENTILAAQEAMKLGANVECDVQFTLDGVMVVIHDDELERTTDGKGIVSKVEYSYIEKLDAGSKFSNKYKELKVPKFIDYLEAVKGAQHIYPELKTYRNNEDISVFTKTLLDKGFEGKATIQSFAYPIVLPEIRKVSSKIRVGALCSDQAAFDYNFDIAKKDSNSMMLISAKIATAENLSKCKENKIDVGVWTIKDESQLKKLVDLGYNKLMLSKYMELTN
jgi:glycerophosphoryl diester phosphodiesterase